MWSVKMRPAAVTMHLHILALLWPAWQHLIPHIFLLVTLMPGSWIATNTQLPECCKKVGRKSDGYFWLNASLPDKKRVTDLTQLFWDCNSYNPIAFFQNILKKYVFASIFFKRGNFQKMNSHYDLWMTGSYVNLTSICEDWWERIISGQCWSESGTISSRHRHPPPLH